MENCSIIRWRTRIVAGEEYMWQEISKFEEILLAICKVCCGGQNFPAEDMLEKRMR